MARQEKFKHKKILFLPFGFLFSLYCALCICIISMHGPNLPHQQKYLLDHKEQYSPSTKETTPKEITFPLNLVTGYDDP